MPDWDKSKYQLDIQVQVYMANNMQMRSSLSMLSNLAVRPVHLAQIPVPV